MLNARCTAHGRGRHEAAGACTAPLHDHHVITHCRPAASCCRLLQIVSCWANFLGGVFPLLSVKLGLNPAVTSAPLMTTVVDSTGLIIYFFIAKLIMRI